MSAPAHKRARPFVQTLFTVPCRHSTASLKRGRARNDDSHISRELTSRPKRKDAAQTNTRTQIEEVADGRRNIHEILDTRESRIPMTMANANGILFLSLCVSSVFLPVD